MSGFFRSKRINIVMASTNNFSSPITAPSSAIRGVGGEYIVRGGDYYNPYDYQEWLKRTTGISSGRESDAYNSYLLAWHREKERQTGAVSIIKNDYVSFIKTITLFLPEAERNTYINDIDWDNALDIEQIIPRCAERLKEITIYLANKREAIKRAKLKYNMTGSKQAVERMFHEYFLKAFTQRNNYVRIDNEEFYKEYPELSAAKDSLRIEIEEIYDDAEYFDKDPSVPAYEYFGVPGESSKEYYADMGYTDEKLEWLFSTGFVSLCADNPIFYTLDDVMASGGGPLSAYTDSYKTVLSDYYKFKLSEKYLGGDAYWLSATVFSDSPDGIYRDHTLLDLTYDLVEGNNLIYVPSGEGSQDVTLSTISPFYLSATTLVEDGAVGSHTHYGADKVFVSYGDIVRGAWLKDDTTLTVSGTMSAMVATGEPFEFRFPLPGYGLSGEGLDWEGASFNNIDKTFFTLPPEDRKAILSAYWGAPTDTISVSTIRINESSLVDCKAVADYRYDMADKVSVRVTDNEDKTHDMTPDGVYNAGFKHAWLYALSSTDIPIEQNKNYISWPYQKYRVEDFSFVQNVPSDSCAPIYLSSVDTASGFIGSKAGYGLFDSDIIYKLDGRVGSPIECAVLSGLAITDFSAISAPSTTWVAAATGCHQTAFNMKCAPNSFFTFIWLDDDTYMDDIVFNFEHLPDCPYVHEEHHSLMHENPAEGKKDIDYRSWKKCTCGAIKYSPLGHPGSAYDDYRGFADVCFLDYLHPIPFSKTTWVCEDFTNPNMYLNYLNSPEFGWYQLTGSSHEPDVGWGKGRWVAGGKAVSTERRFMLRRGYQYKYFRNNIGYDNEYIIDDCLPYLVVRHKHSNRILNLTKPKWVKAVANSSGNWEITNDATDMVVGPNDVLVYDHAPFNTYCITSIGTFEAYEMYSQPISSYDGSAWTNGTVMPLYSVVNVQWPSEPDVDGPVNVRKDLSWVNWEVIPPTGAKTTKMLMADETLDVFGTELGEWKIGCSGYVRNVTALSGSFNQLYTLSETIENAATLEFKDFEWQTTTSGEREILTISEPTIGFPLNIDLSGWDYAGVSANSGVAGIRPLWVEASDLYGDDTRYKGVNKRGGAKMLVDGYIPIVQPVISDLELTSYAHVSYEAKTPLRWIQPLTLNEKHVDMTWCELQLNTTDYSNLSSQIDFEYYRDAVVSGTDIPSDIMFAKTMNGHPMTITYFANAPFTWDEKVSITLLEEAAEDATKNTTVSGVLVAAEHPNANMSNRHHPTIASVPIVDKFYTKADVGGYFVPSLLGASIAVSKNLKTEYDMSATTNGTHVDVIANSEVHALDSGLSKRDNNVSIRVVEDDSRWMKSSFMNGANAGSIIYPSFYQQFMSYKTDYEQRHVNDIGVHFQTDLTDPWNGKLDNEWMDTVNYKTHFTKQQPIKAWRKDQFVTDKVKRWKVDLFGYNYVLVKDSATARIYDERTEVGTIYIRLKNNLVVSLGTVFSELKNDIDGKVYSFDVFGDIMIIRTYEKTIIYRLEYDFYGTSSADRYDGCSLLDTLSNATIIDLAGVLKCAGTWLDSTYRKIYLPHLVVSDGAVYPKLYVFDMSDFTLSSSEYAPDTAEDSVIAESEDVLQPVCSYNQNSHKMSIVFQVRPTETPVGKVVRINIDMLKNSADALEIVPSAIQL